MHDGGVSRSERGGRGRGDGRGRGRGRGGYRGSGRGAGRGAGDSRVNGEKGASSFTVSEEFRIKVADILSSFRDSDTTSVNFPLDLSNTERKFVHEQAGLLGLKSKSSGKEERRYVTVTKKEVKASDTRPLVTLAPALASLLDRYCEKLPPTEADAHARSHGFGDATDWGAWHKGSTRKPPRGPSKPVTAEEDRRWSQSIHRRRNDPACSDILAQRMLLPCWKVNALFTELLAVNAVVIVAGETGCGKSTQIPQFILDHATMGPGCNILVTQPRRISAQSLADRVASERGETVGQTIGYSIQSDHCSSKTTQCLFVTTGILLRRLISDPYLGDLTHVIVDEVHERDRNTDFLLIILRDLLRVRPGLKLILMSATISMTSFERYFKSTGTSVACMQVEGRTCAVDEFYLDEVLDLVKYFDGAMDVDPSLTTSVDLDISSLAMPVTPASSKCALCKTPFTDLVGLAMHAAMCMGDPGDSGEAAATLTLDGVDLGEEDGSGASALERDLHSVRALVAKASGPDSARSSVQRYQAMVSDEEVDLNLVEQLLLLVCTGSDWDRGSVLVFFPGWDEISQMQTQLAAHPVLGNTEQYIVLPLHSAVPAKEQRRVFQPAPHGAVKIVLATNIAETSITINDVLYVIDCGMAKIKMYDEYTKLSHLKSQYIAKANAAQRAGRAGRVRDGFCFHLFSRARYESLADYIKPELMRTPLEELCLQVKLLHHGPDQIATFLSKALEPPSEMAVTNALEILEDIGALRGDETLTRLGYLLAQLPVHPRLGKMVLLSCLLGCYSPLLTIACAASYRDPFVIPVNAKDNKAAKAARSGFAGPSNSDHLALLNAFNQWSVAREKWGFCRSNFLSNATMTSISDMRGNIEEQLQATGFISSASRAFINRNSSNVGAVVGALVSGLYPSLALRSEGKKTFRSRTEARVKVHMGSVVAEMASQPGERDEWLIFEELVRGKTLVTARGNTVVSLASTIIMSLVPLRPPETVEDEGEDEEEKVPAGEVLLCLDDWHVMRFSRLQGAELDLLGHRLLGAFSRFIVKGTLDIGSEDDLTVTTVVAMLAADRKSLTLGNEHATASGHGGQAFRGGRGRGWSGGSGQAATANHRGRGRGRGLASHGRGGA